MADGKDSGAPKDTSGSKPARDPKADAPARPDEKPDKSGKPVTRFG